MGSVVPRRGGAKVLIAPCAIVNDSEPRYDHLPADIASVAMAANSDVVRNFVH